MKKEMSDEAVSQKLIFALKEHKRGLSAADLVSKTALGLEQVNSLLPAIADEYNGRLQVTEGGEILYSFPHGFKSNKKGFAVFVKKAARTIGRGLAIFAKGLFKVWIMVMLIGYFVLFMLIALAALVLSIASTANNSSSSKRGRGGGLWIASNVLDMIWRIWFYSSLVNMTDPDRMHSQKKKKLEKRPLNRAIFSFVFGDGDLHAETATREKKAVLAYITANKGVISLPEFMSLLGITPGEAESEILNYCSEYGGVPELTDDGTIVYRFEELLHRTDTTDRSFAAFSAPLKRIEPFSSNPQKSNVWFCVINLANTLFGGYFLFNALNTGAILSQSALDAASKLYGITYVLINNFLHINPLPVLTIALGVVPLSFSVFFYAIPLIRSIILKKKNEQVKMSNLRKFTFLHIWDNAPAVKAENINPAASVLRPHHFEENVTKLITEMGTYSLPEVTMDEQNKYVYRFSKLDAEKHALGVYKQTIDGAPSLGEIVFDSDAGAINIITEK